MTDSELLELYSKDARKAVRLTVEIYHAYVLRIVSGRLAGAPGEDIEEAVSDVFIRFWQHADKADLSRGSIKAYISAMAQSIASDKRRELAKNSTLPLDGDNEPLSPDPGEEIVERERLIRALKALNDTERRIVLMHHYYSMPHAEITELLGLSENAVRKRLERALKKLRTETEGSP